MTRHICDSLLIASALCILPSVHMKGAIGSRHRFKRDLFGIVKWYQICITTMPYANTQARVGVLCYVNRDHGVTRID